MLKPIPASKQTKRKSPKSEYFYSSSIATIEDLLQHTLWDVETNCREWIHGKHTYGYGRATYQNEPIGVHRLAWILTHPSEILLATDFVCHTCDNPSCCEPTHLFLGDILKNNQDSAKKGRRYHQKMETCEKGHPRIEENLTRMKRKDGRERVECLLCKRENEIRAYYRRRYGIEVEKTTRGTWREVEKGE